MILLIDICKEPLHYLEFVKPIEDILNKKDIEFKVISYKKVNDNVLSNADKVIICGTSLLDNEFLENINFFNWIKNFDKPILGICGGMHVLGLVFDGRLKKKSEIGPIDNIEFSDEFLGVKGRIYVYALHNQYVESDEFIVFSKSNKCNQAIKHKTHPFYGVLYHPEVRNKDLIVSFANI